MLIRLTFSGFLSHPGGNFRVAGVDLKTLLAYAYRLRDEQIVGGPAWISSALWEVSAKAEDSMIPATPTTFDPAVPDAMALMVQALIEDRFHLRSHREVKELPTYNLVVNKGGPKIQKASDQTDPSPNSRPMIGCRLLRAVRSTWSTVPRDIRCRERQSPCRTSRMAWPFRFDEPSWTGPI